MKNVSDKRMRRTKTLFHETLLALLQEKEFSSISISEIVRKADVNRSTFYFHYEKKEDLLEELVQTTLEKMIIAFRKPHISYQEMYITEISTIPLFEHFLENKVFYKTMLSNSVPIHLQDRMIEVMENHYQLIDFYIPQQRDDIDYQLFISYRVHGLIGFIINWIKNGFHYSVEFMSEQLVKIVTTNTQKLYIKN
ncbi:TetR/AcrR family transcriptional regulator [Ureibacillus acetophenoni]|uniref:TetR family transcriptional regulator n=1 Tax=Ureibacillus acetophenoni TaxID=614649 RepID=A0A285US95_9BACL|nr:TetR/AcrR family transcriptional regulator [Ureibacillus acetophenoni]SOC43121.1 TetR family transcriptional regulator [Ureibacillus acetophenoni]